MDTTVYEEELAILRGEESSEFYVDTRFKNVQGGDCFISTPSHGFLVVTPNNQYYKEARAIQSKSGYGYFTDKAVYLEEDCDAGEFIKAVKALL